MQKTRIRDLSSFRWNPFPILLTVLCESLVNRKSRLLKCLSALSVNIQTANLHKQIIGS